MAGETALASPGDLDPPPYEVVLRSGPHSGHQTLRYRRHTQPTHHRHLVFANAELADKGPHPGCDGIKCFEVGYSPGIANEVPPNAAWIVPNHTQAKESTGSSQERHIGGGRQVQRRPIDRGDTYYSSCDRIDLSPC